MGVFMNNGDWLPYYLFIFKCPWNCINDSALRTIPGQVNEIPFFGQLLLIIIIINESTEQWYNSSSKCQRTYSPLWFPSIFALSLLGEFLLIFAACFVLMLWRVKIMFFDQFIKMWCMFCWFLTGWQSYWSKFRET